MVKNLEKPDPVCAKRPHIPLLSSRINDYTTDNLLYYEYFSKHYKLIAIGPSKQTELENPDLKQQINFIERLEENNATMFFNT